MPARPALAPLLGVLLLALAACQTGGGTARGTTGDPATGGGGLPAGYVFDEAPVQGDAPAEDPQTDTAGAAAEPEPEPLPEPEAEPDPTDARFAAARAACEEEGGRFGRAPGGGEARICFRTPRDANAPCRTGAECEGACLARSRTCAPVVPLMGCHEVILSNGIRATECLQ
jgi:hypothetical protein